MVSGLSRRRKEFSGLRPTDIGRDLPGIADLIEISFAEEMSAGGQAMLRELRTLKYLSPFLWLLSLFDPQLHHFLSGFVWVEGSRIVGNVTVNRSQIDPGRWIISNVAAHPDYRRRGIARALIQETIAFVARRGGKLITLQVRSSNVAAQNLYRGLGFSKVSRETDLCLRRIERVDPSQAQKLGLRQMRRQEWPKVYQLALDSIPVPAQRVKPVREDTFRRSLDRVFFAWLDDIVTGHHTLRLVVPANEGFAATLTIREAYRRPPHRLEMMVHPDWRGHLEENLVNEALSILKRYPEHEVWAKVYAHHPEATEALQKRGFIEMKSLDLLALEL